MYHNIFLDLIATIINDHIYHKLEQRNEIIVKMDERGISTNVHYKPLPMLTAYKDLGFDIKDYPNAYNLFENEISLPIYSTLSDEEVEYIIENFLDVLNEY